MAVAATFRGINIVEGTVGDVVSVAIRHDEKRYKIKLKSRRSG